MSNTRQSKKAIRQCDGCGLTHVCEDHHPAGIENNPELVVSVGMDEHRRNLTPRQRNTGLMSRHEKSPSTLAGVSQFLVMMCQQASNPELANGFREFVVPADGTSRVRVRPDRVAKPVEDTDRLLFIHRYFKWVASIMETAMNDPACSVALHPILMTLWRFADTAQNRPLSLLQWAESSGSEHRSTVNDAMTVMAGESAVQSAEHALDDFRAMESVALDFLRWECNRKTTSERATVTA